MKKLNEDQELYVDNFSIECMLGGFWWALFNELWLYALALIIPVVNIFVWAYLCVKGRRIAWNNKAWLSFEQYKDRQVIALIIGIVNICIVLIGIILFVLLFEFVWTIIFDILGAIV
jgi:hypothetical protein